MVTAILVFLLNFAVAADATPAEVSVPKSELVPEKTKSNFQISGEIGTESIQYPTAVEDRPQLSQNNSFDIALNLDYSNSWTTARFQMKGAKSANLNSQYLAVQEAYAGTLGKNGFYLGRKINFWNQADQDWNLGLWQPLHQEDGLRPVPQGLTGLFYNYDGSAVQVLVYGSPIFIPTMNPELAEEDGQLTSESRWFRPLPSRVSVMDARQTELVYRMRIPSLRDLVFQPGYGGRIRLGAAERGPWMAFAAARKPMNHLQVRYDASVITRSSSAVGQIEVGPVAYRHDIFSADVGWNFAHSKLAVSFLHDMPEQKLPENSINEAGFRTDYYQQQPRALQAMTWHLSSTTNLPVLDRELEWKALYLRARTEATNEYDSQGIERSTFIPNRLNFTNAAVIQADLKWSSRWTTGFKYLREFDQLGSIWNVELEYRPARWAFRLGIDLLGVDDEVTQEGDNRFINSFRQNDRVYGGLAYVF